MKKKLLALVALAAYVGTVYGANWALQKFGLIELGLGLGLVAPAGVFFAGAALGLRDYVNENLGRLAVLGGIVAGALLSWKLGAGATIPGGHVSIALASGAAFLLSEAADWAVYSPLRRRTTVGAVAASNVVGAAVDSALFLWLAFGSATAFFVGQFVGKTVMALPAVALVIAYRVHRARHA